MTDTFQWERCDAAGAACVDIGGATGASYLQTAADVGHTIRLRGARDGVPAAESAPTVIVTPATDTSDYDAAIAYTDTRPAFTPTRTVNVTNATQLRAALTDLQAGDLVENTQAGGFDVPGQLNIMKALTGFAVIDLKEGADAVRFNYGGSLSLPSVYFQGAKKIRLYGGKVTNPAGAAGILFHGGCQYITWWRVKVQGTGGHGIGMLTTTESGGTIDHCDIEAEVSDWGNVLARDNHPEPGTGLHACLLADAPTAFTNNRIAIYAHDGDTGAAIELGLPGNVPSGGNTIYLKAERLNKVATQQVAGNALQLWGGTPVGCTVPYLEASDCQGRAVDTNGASASMAGVTVQYGRASAMCQNPNLGSTEPAISPTLEWDSRHGVVYVDVA